MSAIQEGSMLRNTKEANAGPRPLPPQGSNPNTMKHFLILFRGLLQVSGQMTVPAFNETEARQIFARLFPDCSITTICEQRAPIGEAKAPGIQGA